MVGNLRVLSQDYAMNARSWLRQRRWRQTNREYELSIVLMDYYEWQHWPCAVIISFRQSRYSD